MRTQKGDRMVLRVVPAVVGFVLALALVPTGFGYIAWIFPVSSRVPVVVHAVATVLLIAPALGFAATRISFLLTEPNPPKSPFASLPRERLIRYVSASVLLSAVLFAGILLRHSEVSPPRVLSGNVPWWAPDYLANRAAGGASMADFRSLCAILTVLTALLLGMVFPLPDWFRRKRTRTLGRPIPMKCRDAAGVRANHAKAQRWTVQASAAVSTPSDTRHGER